MTWSDVLKGLIPAVPVAFLLILISSVIRTHIHIFISGNPHEQKYRIHLENMDDIASLDNIRLELRIRGQGSFSPKCTQHLGLAPWPAAFTSKFEERTAVFTAAGLRGGERWLFEIFTNGGEQGVEVACRIGRRELPIISSDAVAEFADNPSTSPLNRWLGLPLEVDPIGWTTLGQSIFAPEPTVRVC
ncbi:hypothetical protein [Myxococcus sp. Y35]|uniref:hypothetical protein n=1 Tax=Pseudomyxococcus flavus TaxID=3115648 RepID=UPI003CEC294D